MKRITLYHTPCGWVADFHGEKDVIEVFGTDLVPTPYTANATAAMVLSTIQRLNPGAQISIGWSGDPQTNR